MSYDRVTCHDLDDSTLQAEIDLKVAPDNVYEAWTRPERFSKWFGPRSGGSLQVDRFDCAVGGEYDVTILFADGDRAHLLGRYLELDPPKRISFTWQWMENEKPSPETLVTVDLLPTETGTHLKLVHARFPSVESRDEHHGWESMLDLLATYIEA